MTNDFTKGAEAMREACVQIAAAKAEEYLSGEHDNKEVGQNSVQILQAIRAIDVGEI